MSKRDIVIFLFKWKKSLIGYFLLVIALSVLLVYAIPPKYEAVATILVESNRAPVMRADVAYGVEQMSVLNSEIAIIRSNTVFALTADKIGNFDAEKGDAVDEKEPGGLIMEMFNAIVQWTIDIGLREPTTAREDLISNLEDELKVEPQPNSNVITLSYKSDNPEKAAEIVNTVTENYIQQHLRIFSSGGTSELYRIQIERREKDLKWLRKKLADYKREKSVSALNETMRAQVQQQTQLTSELIKIQRELAELHTRFGTGHTKVALAEERLNNTQKSLGKITKKLQSLEREETAIGDMEIEITSVEKSIQSYKSRYQDEQLVSLANPDVINVLIIEEAVPPTRPGHSRLFYIVLAAAGGLLLSFAIAFIKEYFDHRVTDPEVASQLLGVPTLGSLEKA